jgi:putative ABC transport system permease protein
MIFSRVKLMFRLAARNIYLNWRHSLATVLAIAAGFTSVALLDGFISSINAISEDGTTHKGMVGHVLIEKGGTKDHLFEDPWRYSLSKHDQEVVGGWLAEDPRVEASMRYLLVTGLLSNGKSSTIFMGGGLEEEQGVKFRGDMWKWNAVAGKPLYLAPSGFVMGLGMAKRMDCQVAETGYLKPDYSYIAEERPMNCRSRDFQLSTTTEHSQVNAISLPPSGVMDLQIREYNDKVLFMPLAVAQQLVDTDRITRYSVLLRDGEKAQAAFVTDYRKRARDAGIDIEVLHWLDHPVGAAAKGGIEILNIFRLLFLAVVAVIAVMSVANSLMKSINERIREIGTLRSYGFRRNDIVLLFSFEGLLLGLSACLGGVMISFVLAYAITASNLSFNAGVTSTPIPIRILFEFGTWATTAGVLSAITFFASYVVSRRAAGLTIADALRHVA